MGNASEPRDLEERIGWIKASISSRVDELSRRVDRMRHFSDLTDAVGKHPWTAVGIGFAAGLLIAAIRPARGGPQRESLLGASLRTVLVSVAATYGRKLAQQWMDDHFHRELDPGNGRAPAHTVPRTPPREQH